MKVEVASPEPHSILVIHDMISDGEADSLIEQVIVKGIVNLVDFPSAIGMCTIKKPVSILLKNKN